MKNNKNNRVNNVKKNISQQFLQSFYEHIDTMSLTFPV